MNEADESYITKTKIKPFYDVKKTWPGEFDPAKGKNAYQVFGPLFDLLDREEEMEEPEG